MGYIDQLRASAKRWLSGFVPMPGAMASPDGTSILIDPTMTGADAALRSAAYWACTRLISCSVGSLPLHIFQATPEGKQKAVNHPLYNLLTQQPNPWMTTPEYVQCTVMNLLTWGNAYTLPDYQDGQVVGLWPLRPDRVTSYIESTTALLKYRYVDLTGRVSIFTPPDILHFRVFTLDGITGLAPLDYHRLTFGFETAAGGYASAIYNNGGRPSGVLEFPSTLQDTQKAAIAESWKAMHGGPSNVGNTAILDNGVKYNPISVPLQQMEYINSQRFSVEQIARIFGVPPHLVGAATQPTYASVEQQSLEFVRYTLQPIVIGIERTIQTHLFQNPYFVRFNLAGFERSDIKTRYEAYAIGRQWGFLSVNDIRDIEDSNSIPEGDIYLQPLNMVPAASVPTQQIGVKQP